MRRIWSDLLCGFGGSWWWSRKASTRLCDSLNASGHSGPAGAVVASCPPWSPLSCPRELVGVHVIMSCDLSASMFSWRVMCVDGVGRVVLSAPKWRRLMADDLAASRST